MDTMNNKIEFGERLKMARSVNNLKLDEVASQLGTTKSALSRYESGDRTPDHNIIKKLSSIYKVSTDFLISGSYYTYLQMPGQLMLDFESGKTKEITKEEHDISRKLLIEKVKKVASAEVEQLDSTTLINLLDLDGDHLRVIAHISHQSYHLKHSIKRLTDLPTHYLDELANIIDKK
ncbi:helix-turn-helix domain-containing protein [Bacillus infantis]|uniref:helix-turn-helix domain-containing protein n=1 Tax=Bacillus infantis TaxID=324767 RepID=UPI001CD505BF|nr:helix-turn-helix transcriptional regulator [Bacillus infantis]MCA1040556.1 helix-turn-helix domain-containing protein [Bacillus infantis]